VILTKEGGSLGFSIIGGTDHSCTPFGAKEPGIFISHVSIPIYCFVYSDINNRTILYQVVPGGVAAKSGKLRLGDRLLKVNGKSLLGSTHSEAVQHLLQPTPQLTLTVRHDPLPKGYQVYLCIIQ